MVQPVSSLLLVKHLCTDTDSVERLPRNSEACSQERLQAAFFELCCEYFLNHSQREESLTFVKNPMCCLLEDKAKAGKLTIFPFTDQISKIGLKPAVWRFGIRPRAQACIFPPGCIRQFLICLLADPGRLSAESGDSPFEREGLEVSHFEEHGSAEGLHPLQAEAC